MSHIIFFNVLGSKLMENHVWIQNFDFHWNHIGDLGLFSVDFSCFWPKKPVKKTTLFLRPKNENLSHRNFSYCWNATFLWVRFLKIDPEKKCCFFLTISIILSENRPWTRKNQFSQLYEVLSISNLFHR